MSNYHALDIQFCRLDTLLRVERSILVDKLEPLAAIQLEKERVRKRRNELYVETPLTQKPKRPTVYFEGV